MVVIDTALQRQRSAGAFPGTVAETSADDEAQIEILKTVILVVVERIDFHARTELAIVLPAAPDGLRRVGTEPVCGRRGFYGVEIERNFAS